MIVRVKFMQIKFIYNHVIRFIYANRKYPWGLEIKLKGDGFYPEIYEKITPRLSFVHFFLRSCIKFIVYSLCK